MRQDLEGVRIRVTIGFYQDCPGEVDNSLALDSVAVGSLGDTEFYSNRGSFMNQAMLNLLAAAAEHARLDLASLSRMLVAEQSTLEARSCSRGKEPVSASSREEGAPAGLFIPGIGLLVIRTPDVGSDPSDSLPL